MLVALLQGSAVIGWPGEVVTFGGIPTARSSAWSASLALRRSQRLFRLARLRGVIVGDDSGLATKTNPPNALLAGTAMGSLRNVSI